jgi:hypothetical protein
MDLTDRCWFPLLVDDSTGIYGPKVAPSGLLAEFSANVIDPAAMK